MLKILFKTNSHHSVIPISTLIQYNQLICSPFKDQIFQYIFHFLLDYPSSICLQQCANSLRQIFSVQEFDEFKFSALKFLIDSEMTLECSEIFVLFGEAIYLDLELAQHFENDILSIFSTLVQCDNPSIYIEGMILCLLGLVQFEEIQILPIEPSIQAFNIVSTIQNVPIYIY
jgi:hypothetical protein